MQFTRLGLYRVLVAFLPIALGIIALPVAAQQTPTPAAVSFQSTSQEQPFSRSADVVRSIDGYWSGVFSAAGLPYTTPGLVVADRPTLTPCDPLNENNPAFYCYLDSTIYLWQPFLNKNATFGDFAPITILAHEWGHHVQFLVHELNPGGNTLELQADCLAGAYSRQADADGLLEPGDIPEAILVSSQAGDPIFFPEDSPGAHGSGPDRMRAFHVGNRDGIEGCDLPLLAGGIPSPGPTPAPPVAALAPTVLAPVPVNVPVPPTVVSHPVNAPGDDSSSNAPSPGGLPALPTILPLDHGACFRVEADGSYTLDELVDRLGGSAEARTRLEEWGWQGSVYRTFACDTPPKGEAGWVDVAVHRFADAASAQQALDYFSAERAQGTNLYAGTPPAIGDRAAVLSGPTSNGTEFTLYVSSGPLLIRVTGVSPSGIPFINVMKVASALLSTPLPEAPPTPSQTPAQTVDVQPTVPSAAPPTAPLPPSSLPASAYLPSTLPLTYASCFNVADQGVYSYEAVASFLTDAGATQGTIAALDWQDGAYIDYRCPDPPSGGASFLEAIVHRFGSAQAAKAAAPYWQSGYVPTQPNEVYLCESAAAFVICTDGLASSASPTRDAQALLGQVVASVPGGTMTQSLPESPPNETQGIAADLPASLPLGHATCFRADDVVVYDFSTLLDRFADVPDAASTLQDLGWQAGAYRQFSCDTPPDGGVGWIDMSVLQFGDAASASAAVPFLVNARTAGSPMQLAAAPHLGETSMAIIEPSEQGSEYTLWVSTGPLVFRVTGIAPSGDPTPDVAQVMQELLVARGSIDQGSGQPSPAPTLPALTPTPSPLVFPTATPAPTPTPFPTATPAPKAKPIPQPAVTPTPTPGPQQTSTATSAPASILEPTPTTEPTATPRAIVLPTALPSATASSVVPPLTLTPVVDRGAIVEQLLTTPFPDDLLGFGYPWDPRWDEETGTVMIVTSVNPIGSSMSFHVYDDPQEAIRAQTRWLRSNQPWLQAEDVSGPEMGPSALIAVPMNPDSRMAVCSSVVGSVETRVVAIASPQYETNRSFINSIVLDNCAGAVAHLRSVLGEEP